MTSSRNVLLLLALAIGIAAFLVPAGASASADARDFWTKDRMRQAIPAEELADPGPAHGAGAWVRGGEQGAASYVPPARPGAVPGAGLRSGAPPKAPGVEAPDALPLLAGVSRELVADPAAKAIRTHGKIFFTIRSKGGKPKMYVCSGTVVTSRVQSLVITAGHCIFDAKATDRFMDNWVFVPAYSKDKRPYGVWPARSLVTTKEWRRGGNIRFDIGAALLGRNASGARIQQVVGSRGIAFNQPRKQRYEAFGYPHTDPVGGEFDGDKEYICRSGMTRRDSPLSGPGPRTTQIRCDMTAGSSGGGWVAGGAVRSVTSYSYNSDVTHLYGPYFSKTAQSLYKAVRSGIDKRSRKKVSVSALRKPRR